MQMENQKSKRSLIAIILLVISIFFLYEGPFMAFSLVTARDGHQQSVKMLLNKEVIYGFSDIQNSYAYQAIIGSALGIGISLVLLFFALNKIAATTMVLTNCFLIFCAIRTFDYFDNYVNSFSSIVGPGVVGVFGCLVLSALFAIVQAFKQKRKPKVYNVLKNF